MTAPDTPPSLAQAVVRRRYTFFRQIREGRTYLVFLGGCFFVAGAVYPYPHLAMWVGFALAAYSTIANDSIQTVGTFIASNGHRPWWQLWLYIGGIFLATVLYSWLVYDGDVSFQRLASKGLTEAPAQFTFLQVAAPIFLLILTRLRMPVSTTFLILSCFSTAASGIGAMLVKSVSGYVVAFVGALAVWMALSGAIRRRFVGAPHPAWGPAQWLSTGLLWAAWIMQDAANIAVYLPRHLSAGAFAFFALFVFLGLGVLFYLRGERIQRVVDEKSDVVDVRSATLIDFVYALILFGFKEISTIPMSTTWVFIGLLAGREVAMSFTDGATRGRPLRESLRLMRKDLAYAGVGLAVSIALAMATNPIVLGEVRAWLGR